MNRRQRRSDGKKSQRIPGSPALATPNALYEAGLRHLRAEQYLDAQICCQQALAGDPNHADTLHLMGVVSFRAKQYDHAVEWIVRAIRQEPKAEYLSSLGLTLQQQGRYEEALKTFDKAIQLEPDDGELWRNLGNVLADLKRPADAVLSLQHALKLDPHNWSAANKCGIFLYELKRFDEALLCFSLCNELEPNNALTLYMRGRALADLNRREEALADSQTAHELDPGDVDICNSIGAVLQALNRHDQAIGAFDKALALRPDFSEALINKAISLGHFRRFEEALLLLDQALEFQRTRVAALYNKALLLSELHRFDEALAIYEHLKMIDPGNAAADWNSSVLYLLTGKNFEAGWIGREARWNAPGPSNSYPKFPQPRWSGEQSVEGRTVLIYADEGLGDSIQFARYVPMVAARGARVILVVGSPLCSLLSGLPGVSQCLSKPIEAPPEFDFHCSMSSLPLIFGTRLDTIPSAISFLPLLTEARIKAWEHRLGPREKLRVGLVWSGNPHHVNDRTRSIPLRSFSSILNVDAAFFSLQKDPRPEDKAILLQRTDIIDRTTDLDDLADTAALVGCLDLIVTVDTSVAHLAGALGRPTWLLLPYVPDWRWMLDRDDTPWYSTVRLFRQSETRDYGEVLDQVRTELLTLVTAK